MSSVFELHFNPNPKKEKTAFDTFCFLPKTWQEKKLGNLFVVAETEGPSFSNFNRQQMLNNLAEIVKKYFYQKPVFGSYDSFQIGLNQANDFLSDWKGALNFAAVAISPKCGIKVSKTGNLKIILFRNSEAFDIGSNLNSQITAGKIFPDVIEGDLQKRDRLLVATSEVFQSFQAEQILEKLAQCPKPSQVKQVFKEKKKIIQEFSGACLLAFIKKQRIVSFFSRFPRS